MTLHFYKILISCAFLGLTIGLKAQTTTENYIKTIECLDATCTEKKETVVYFDGLGREKQILQVEASPTGKTIAVPIEYDGFGRQAKDYLPVPLSSNTNAFSANAEIIGTGSSFYSGEPAYSEKTFEDSPLNRVLAQSAPGNTWKKGGGHEIQFQYQTNSTGEVKRYDVVGNNVVQNEFYSPGSLYKIVTTDENGQPIQEFKDKEERIVLKRIHTPSTDANNSSGNHDTFYIYDIYGNLRFVIPPLLADLAITPANLDELGYQYIYDDKNRLIEKKLPGKGWEYMVYDKQNRLVASRDSQNDWIFTKYDQFGRVVYTGTLASSDRSSLQTAYNNSTILNEKRLTSGGVSNNGLTNILYSNEAYPTSFLKLLSVNYYDHYNGLAVTPASTDGQSVVGADEIKTKGLAVASFTNVIGTTEWSKGYTFYDAKYIRPIANQLINNLGGYTTTASVLDFRGKVKKTTTKHKRDNGATELTLVDEFDYYPNELLKYQAHQINGGIKEYIAQNSYNEINQLITKGVGNSNQSTPLQTVDYKYNIRGWLTDINDVNNLGTGTYKDLFSFALHYDELFPGYGFRPGKYNGNISQVRWNTTTAGVIRNYVYEYDDLNRLTGSYYIKGNYIVGDAYNEYARYDKNGNIKKMWRSGNQDVSGQIIWIDDLDYTYQTNSNKLLAVKDHHGNSTGSFIDGNTTGNDYAYDVNGNLIQDLNKEITKISYNHLNLPTEVLWSSTKKINYSYDASGVKLRKTVTDGTKITTTDYLGGFQYKDDVLQFFPTAEGYVNVTNGNAFNYVYNYTDHLGNIRVSYQKESNGSLKVLEENNYYPFGLKHEGYNNTNLANQNYKYKYQGQELQDEFGLGWYNYRYRNYDPTIGRFFGVDPISEDYYNISTYQFAHNNPVWKIEIEGLEGAPTTNQDIQSSAGNNRDPELEFLEMTAGSINSIRASFSNLVVRGINTLTNNSINKKYEVENGALVLYKDVPKETTGEKIINTIGDVATLALTVIGGVEGTLTAQGGKTVLANTVNDTKQTAVKTYQTYTKTHPITKEVYSGKTSGTGTAFENVAKRDKSHHMNKKGFGAAVLDNSSTNKDAIRGREQYLIYKNGGAKSQGGTSGNAINGVSESNKNREKYLNAAKVFGL